MRMKLLKYSVGHLKARACVRAKRRLAPRRQRYQVEVPREEVWVRPYPDDPSEVKMKGSNKFRRRYRKGTGENPYRGPRVTRLPQQQARLEHRAVRHGVYVPSIPGVELKIKKSVRAVAVKTYGKIVFRKTRAGRKFVKRVKVS